MKKILISIFCVIAFSVSAMEKQTTFNKELFDKAQSDGKFVVVSSWIKYCSSCAGQMKILNKAKKKTSYQISNLTILSLFHLR